VSLYELPAGPYAVEVVVGEWWLGDRNCIRVWGPRKPCGDDAQEWPHVLTIRWRGWRRVSDTGRVVARARRGIYRSLYSPDIGMPCANAHAANFREAMERIDKLPPQDRSAMHNRSQEGEPSDG
jgi:hypothetical protein